MSVCVCALYAVWWRRERRIYGINLLAAAVHRALQQPQRRRRRLFVCVRDDGRIEGEHQPPHHSLTHSHTTTIEEECVNVLSVGRSVGSLTCLLACLAPAHYFQRHTRRSFVVCSLVSVCVCVSAFRPSLSPPARPPALFCYYHTHRHIRAHPICILCLSLSLRKIAADRPPSPPPIRP